MRVRNSAARQGCATSQLVRRRGASAPTAAPRVRWRPLRCRLPVWETSTDLTMCSSCMCCLIAKLACNCTQSKFMWRAPCQALCYSGVRSSTLPCRKQARGNVLPVSLYDSTEAQRESSAASALLTGASRACSAAAHTARRWWAGLGAARLPARSSTASLSKRAAAPRSTTTRPKTAATRR